MSISASALDLLRGPQFFSGLRDRGGDRSCATSFSSFPTTGRSSLRERFHLFAPCRDAAAASEIADAHGFERLLVRNSRDFRQRGGAQFVERVRLIVGTLNSVINVKSAIAI